MYERETWHLLNVFFTAGLRRESPPSDGRRSEKTLPSATHYQSTLWAVHFFLEAGPAGDLSAHHLAGRDTTPSTRMGIEPFKGRDTLLSSVLYRFNVQLRERKAEDGEEENFVRGGIVAWEVVAVHICICDATSIYFIQRRSCLES